MWPIFEQSLSRFQELESQISDSAVVANRPLYTKTAKGDVLPTLNGAPRLCLHAVELGFEHPVSNEHLHWTMPLPRDLARYVRTLK